MSAATQQALWQKAKLFTDRAFEADRGGSMFPLWATLALELLARAALAHVHPALLADPQKGANLLYALGHSTTAPPKSVSAKTVFARCKEIIPRFTETEEKHSMALVGRRNADLHSGELAFEQFQTASWLAGYFASCKVLVEFQEKTLEELFGPEEAAAAIEMIDEVTATVQAAVNRKIADAKTAFDALEANERDARLLRPPPRINVENKVQPCPACGGHATVLGKVVSADEPRTEDGMLLRTINVLPTMLVCATCQLMLEDHGELHAAALGGQYNVTETLDPVEHFGIYEEPDYGND